MPVLADGKLDALVQRRQAVQRLWLRGHQIGEIALRLGIEPHLVAKDIRAFRNQLYKENAAAVQEHAEQSVAIFRMAQTKLWGLYDEAETHHARVRILDEIRQMELAVAKVRGLLTSRVQADVVHHVKLYDFHDAYPAQKPPGIQDAERKLLPEGIEVIEPEPGHEPAGNDRAKAIPYRDPESGIATLPDGTIVDLVAIAEEMSQPPQES